MQVNGEIENNSGNAAITNGVFNTDLFGNELNRIQIPKKQLDSKELNRERKVVFRKEKEKERVKHYYANENGFSTNNLSIPSEFKNKIITGDSLDVLRELPDNCVDLIFTSPPYNFGLDYAGMEIDANHWEKFFEKLFAVLDECVRVLKYSGRLIINVQPLFSDYIPTHHIISSHLMSRQLIWKGEILWEKNNYNCKYTAWGSWKSPSNPYLKYTWEFIEVFCKGEMKKEGDQKHADMTPEQFKEWVVAKWSIAPERNMKKYDHPAMFPEALAERIIKLFSFKGDTVLDPFNGTGTTTAVASKTGRGYIGVDISEKYNQIAEERARNVFNQ